MCVKVSVMTIIGDQLDFEDVSRCEFDKDSDIFIIENDHGIKTVMPRESLIMFTMIDKTDKPDKPESGDGDNNIVSLMGDSN